MSEFITIKRWSLRDGRQESELVELVREEIASHYEKLPGFVRLGLLHIAGTRSYLALQHGKNRDTWRATVESDDYEFWLQGYAPMLERWDKLMIFEEDWECEELLHKGNATLQNGVEHQRTGDLVSDKPSTVSNTRRRPLGPSTGSGTASSGSGLG